MKGLTVWQPHAIMLATGCRVIETRSWPTRYRGDLLVHCAKRWNEDIIAVQRDVSDDARAGRMIVAAGEHLARTPNRELLGCGLALAELYDCRPIPNHASAPEATFGDRKYGGWGDGRFGFFLRNLRPLRRPVEIRGAQGLWDVTEEDRNRVKENVECG